MRLGIASTVLGLGLISLACAESSQAAMRLSTDIPAQPLGVALQRLARERKFQIVYAYDDLSNVQTHGAVGELSSEEALTQLLSGTGFTFRYVDDKTVTIVPKASAAIPSSRTQGATSKVSGKDEEPSGKGQGSLWNRFRLAQAAEGTTSGASSVSAQTSKPVGLEEVVITAQKKVERLQDVPVPVSVIQGDKLTTQNITLLQDYFSTVPGLSYIEGGAQDQQTISIRGISTGSGQNPTVGITVDGIPYGGSTSFDGGNGVPDIDPNDLDRIEVLRGPQGTLYGSNSMGGLINFVTKDPSTSGFSGHVAAGLGAVYNGAKPGYNLRGAANIPVNDALALRASIFTRQDSGYVDNPVVGINGINEHHAYGGRLAAKWNLSDNITWKVSALYQRLKADGSDDINIGPGYAALGLSGLQQNYPPGFGGFRGVGGYIRTDQAYSSDLRIRFGDMELTSLTGYNIHKYRDSWDYTYAIGGTDPASLTEMNFGVPYAPVTDDSPTKKVSQELRLSGTFFRNLDWLIGGFYTHEHNDSFEQIFAENAAGALTGLWWTNINTSAYEEYATFADATYHFTDQFDVQLGGRESRSIPKSLPGAATGQFNVIFGLPYENHYLEQDADARKFTYLITPRFKISPDLMIYARVATGFRPGFSNGNLARVNHLPPQVDPDTTTNYELGLKGDFIDHKLFVDASVFYIDWSGIQFGAVSNRIFYHANAGSAKSEGVELSITAHPIQGLTVAGWISYDDAVLTQDIPAVDGYGPSGTPLPYSSRWSGYISAQQNFPIADAVIGDIGGELSLVGDRKGNFTSSQSSPRQDYPAYAQANLRAGVLYKSWTANLYVNNVGDRRGLVGGGVFPSVGFEYITPRTVGLNVSREF